MPSGRKPAPGPLTIEVTALLREHIARKKWAYNQVAEAAGIAPSTFSAIVNGQKQIDLEQLDRIAWAVGLDMVDDLIVKAEATTADRQARKGWPADRLTDPK